MAKTTKKNAPTDHVIYVRGEFIGDDGKKHLSYGTIGAAWRDEEGQIASVKLDTIPVSWNGVLYFRPRKEAETTEGGAE
ncbi:MAG TPA: hypothetical protein VGV17_05720 [Bosea sp. (in: a-proteobacteria)]|jgi:hypothetical protein|uniref:hypothetical protein n=1 Tax=Bosea sp. (in: a-proteobacteria) TaxID=1871050 RepID=UPI002DDD2E85|nr:hypothetical protein [Bosea sp. (in: a-proteobacteria)]HEV2553238.1 hypothetical protein [Bosea sp. (in: a-proteobacteria)]